jgi:phosphatidylserine decarboxylase
MRPIARPEDDCVIANSCESNPYRVANNVHRRDKFRPKGQLYSVIDTLGHDELAEQFVGGTIFQAPLSSLSHHWWHSPAGGEIVKGCVRGDTYYLELLFEGFADPHGPNPDGEGTGQSYISAIASRAMISIEADNTSIGLMCVILVGMVEVSTCDIAVKIGKHLKKMGSAWLGEFPHSDIPEVSALTRSNLVSFRWLHSLRFL